MIVSIIGDRRNNSEDDIIEHIETSSKIQFSRVIVFLTTRSGRRIALKLDWQTLKGMLPKSPSIIKQLEAGKGKNVFLYMLEMAEATIEFGGSDFVISSGKEMEAGESDKNQADETKQETETTKEEDTDLRDTFKLCKDIFEEKFGLYGSSFCFMHPETVTDQLYMKATILKKRITDRDKGERFKYFFFEDVCGEFAAVVNYGIIALRQGGFCLPDSGVPESPTKFYTDQMEAALSLISEKGIEYGELWREVRIGTLADMIYTKVRRLKGIEDQYRFGSMTKEGYHKFAGDQYRDLINYGLFGVVRMTEIADVMAFEMEEDETDEEEGYE